MFLKILIQMEDFSFFFQIKYILIRKSCYILLCVFYAPTSSHLSLHLFCVYRQWIFPIFVDSFHSKMLEIAKQLDSVYNYWIQQTPISPTFWCVLVINVYFLFSWIFCLFLMLIFFSAMTVMICIAAKNEKNKMKNLKLEQIPIPFH